VYDVVGVVLVVLLVARRSVVQIKILETIVRLVN